MKSSEFVNKSHPLSRFLQKTLDDLEEFRHKHQILEEQQKELLSHKQQAPLKLSTQNQKQVHMEIIENEYDVD